MKIIETGIKDLVVIEPQVFGDHRGYFLESFKKDWFKEHFPDLEFIQDNESQSQRGVLRGLHFQNPPFAQTKLVRVIHGEVLDVAVDLRKDSPTYGQHVSILLSAENKKQFLVPKGFAHGFVVLSDSAIFSYKVDNPYAPQDEDGIMWNDGDLKIDWSISDQEVQLSAKDKSLGAFKTLESPF
jgi:dTDP-4-dehydrorhamnose 3,5-epimerase